MKWAMPIMAAAALGLAACQTTKPTVSFQNAPVSAPGGAKAETISGQFAKPDGPGPFPAVVLLHTCGGVGPHLEGWSSFLASQGYASLIVDSFGSRRLGRCPNGRSPLYFSGAEMVSDAYGALDWLAARPDVVADRVYVMGFSLGGWAINELAKKPSQSRTNRNFRGGISLYAPCYYQGRLMFPALAIIGSRDGPEIASCELAVERRPSPDAEVHILPGVYHAFDQALGSSITLDHGGRPMLYDAAAVRRTEDLVAAFLARTK